MRLVALAVVFLLAGCTGPSSPAVADPATSSNAAPVPAGKGPCATLEEALDHQLVVLLVSMTGGLGPNGAIVGPWSNGTLDVVHDDMTVGSVVLDADGCGSFALPSLGRYTFRAQGEGSCRSTEEESIEQVGPAGHVLRLHLSMPCA